MNKSVSEHELAQGRSSEFRENGIDVPIDSIDPGTLQNLIAEFVTREWAEMGDSSHTLEDKIGQVRQQLKDRKAKVVFDFTSNSCNIVPYEVKNQL